jgi:hydroxyethylthiazole kinase-like uncharacterized protein yjeF
MKGTFMVLEKQFGEADARAALPHLKFDDNKFTRGMCELIVGGPEFPGAGVLASLAANSLAAGYVTTYTWKDAARAIRAKQPSIVVRKPKEFLARDHAAAPGKPKAVVIGCGLSPDDEAAELVLAALQVEVPLVMDGGALAFMNRADVKEALVTRAKNKFPTVLTPHAGEAARLLKAEAGRCAEQESLFDTSDPSWQWVHERGEQYAAADPKADPAQAAALIANAYGAVCVLKGPDTYISVPGFVQESDEHTVLVVTEGTPALAKAGTGDVLAGTIGSFVASGMALEAACSLGVFLHARAGRLAGEALGELCVTAERVLHYIPKAVCSLA